MDYYRCISVCDIKNGEFIKRIYLSSHFSMRTQVVSFLVDETCFMLNFPNVLTYLIMMVNLSKELKNLIQIVYIILI